MKKKKIVVIVLVIVICIATICTVFYLKSKKNKENERYISNVEFLLSQMNDCVSKLDYVYNLAYRTWNDANFGIYEVDTAQYTQPSGVSVDGASAMIMMYGDSLVNTKITSIIDSQVTINNSANTLSQHACKDFTDLAQNIESLNKIINSMIDICISFDCDKDFSQYDELKNTYDDIFNTAMNNLDK